MHIYLSIPNFDSLLDVDVFQAQMNKNNDNNEDVETEDENTCVHYNDIIILIAKKTTNSV